MRVFACTRQKARWPDKWEFIDISTVPRKGDILSLERADGLHGFWDVVQVMLTRREALVWLKRNATFHKPPYAEVKAAQDAKAAKAQQEYDALFTESNLQFHQMVKDWATELEKNNQ